MTQLKKGDFIEIEYTGRLDTGEVFDTTDETEAKKADIHRNKMMYGAVGICVGEGQVLKGLDEALEDKEENKKYTIPLPAEKAFGKKQAKLVQMIPMSKFKQQNVQPMPGLQLNIDNMLATVKNVSGGRVLVDFNHPLSGHDVTYEVKIGKRLEKAEEKVRALAELHFSRKDIGVAVKGEVAELTFVTAIPPEIAKKFEEGFGKEVEKLVKEVTSVKVIAKEEEKDKK